MDKFKKALEFTLKWEGGFSDHPSDKGGATNFGITQLAYDLFRDCALTYRQSVKKITKQEVEDIYYEFYWRIICADSMDLPLATVCFDWCVHSGPKRVIRALQKILGVAPDGIFGKDTFVAFKMQHPEQRQNLPYLMISAREAFLKSIAVGKQKVFLKGWLNRTKDLRRFIDTECE